ncbi:peptide ABC transporter permease [Bifidobacterium ramosum]|uniref:ABC transporter permease subunit n=1 Tax=Bifidobacterium ramosum TaxID=1798158 RepID=A0A6L4X1R8_9BIFI|nr:ABC transporter permease [Bifidobacterium ramosum]KAB8288283.1 peptide ABC transporter permease [Bifidobacterium ramosum]NEG71679.1 ABC transporter permease subunit [Bifidobacterium ramosum]
MSVADIGIAGVVPGEIAGVRHGVEHGVKRDGERRDDVRGVERDVTHDVTRDVTRDVADGPADPAAVPDALFVPRAAAVADHDAADVPHLSHAVQAWLRLRHNKTAIAAAIVLVSLFVVAFSAPVLAPADPNAQKVEYANLPPYWFSDAAEQYRLIGAQNQHFVLGTDQFGRDLLSRLLYGTRISLTISLVAAVLDIAIGVTWGLVSGLASRRVDDLMQRVLEIISGVPSLIVVVLMLLVFQPGLVSIIVAMAITFWITMARVVRGQTLQIRSLEYVQAAIVLGTPRAAIAVRHVLPNILNLIIIRLMFSIPTAIFFETFLSFIGVGMKIPNASIGTLLNDGFKVVRIYPYQMWIPAAVLCVIMLSFNLCADGLRDVLDPKMRG